MTVLNRQHRYRITESDINYIPYQSNIIKWHDFSDKTYWYIEVNNCNSFKESVWLEAIPPIVLNGIKSGSITLAVSNYAESFDSIVEPIYDLLLGKFGIHEDNLILFTGCRDILSELIRVSELHNKTQIKVVLSSEFEYQIQQGEKITPRIKQYHKTYTKKFVNLNRRWRTHRPAFVGLLSLNDLAKFGHISLATNETGSWETEWDRMVDRFSNLKNLFESNKSNLMKLQFITDEYDLNVNPHWYYPSLGDIHDDSYFSIVSETNFHKNESRFLTEKTFKAVQFKHPFILISPPHSLEFFREKGYKSFYPFVDESYDLEENDEKRLLMVLAETKRLCNLTDGEVEEFVQATKEICDFNYKVLMSKTKFSTELN
jgi:hypothetical protein